LLLYISYLELSSEGNRCDHKEDVLVFAVQSLYQDRNRTLSSKEVWKVFAPLQPTIN